MSHTIDRMHELQKYGRKIYQLDIEKNKGSHDNPGYKNDEQTDPRSKIW